MRPCSGAGPHSQQGEVTKLVSLIGISKVRVISKKTRAASKRQRRFARALRWRSEPYFRSTGSSAPGKLDRGPQSGIKRLFDGAQRSDQLRLIAHGRDDVEAHWEVFLCQSTGD
jgi:hypothetical protein